MKTYFHAFLMTQTMFCALPFPSKTWDEEARPKMMLFLPLIGLEIGMIWFGLSRLCAFLAIPRLISALILTAYPFLVTGFIHLDGYMDVLDAVRSWRSADKRIQILKDPHVGSMAVVGCVIGLLALFAGFASGIKNDLLLIFIPVVSRCCSAAAVTALKPISVSQYAGQKMKKRQAIVLLVLLPAAGLLAGLLLGLSALPLVALAAAYGIALRRGCKSLGGVNGDITGYSLTIGEICAVLTAVFS